MLVEHEDKESSIAKSILSLFNSYLGFKQTKKRQPNHHKHLFVRSGGGLQPHTPTRTTDAYITPQTVTAPITIIDDRHDDPQDWAYLSKSESSISSAGSSWSSVHSNNPMNHHHHRASISSMTLSEILCDHYVQTHSSNPSNQEPVPLETYRVFEASRRNSALSHHSNSSDHSLTSPNDDVDDDDDDDESWFIWDNLQKTREWIQVVNEELFLPKEKVTTEVTIAVQPKSRGIRANSAHLRMIVAEVNMMRVNKIVCPLRARGSLPARLDTFTPNTPSPLST